MNNHILNIDSSKYSSFQKAVGPVKHPLTNDYLFKTLLQKNESVLKALICALLHLDAGTITNISITNPIIPGENVNEKTVILDVIVIFNNSGRINLEMQVVNRHNWTDRATIYACRNIAKISKGKKYSSLKPVFQIGFLDFTLFPDHPSFYATYKLSDIKTHHIFTDKLCIGVVDLTSISLATPDDKSYNIDKWAKLFKAKTWEDIQMLAAQDVNISSAATTLYELSEDERIQQECEAREDYLLQEQELVDLLAEKDQEIAKLKSLLAEKQ